MGSRSKGPRREVTQFQYHRTLSAGPPGESKFARRLRRRSGRSTFAVALASEIAAGASPRRRRGVGKRPKGQLRQTRQNRLCRVSAPGIPQRVRKLFRRVARQEDPLAADQRVADLSAAWNRLTHREKGVFRKSLERRTGIA